MEKYHVVPEVFYKNEEYAHIQSKLYLPTSVRARQNISIAQLFHDFLSFTFSDKRYLANIIFTIRQLKMVRRRSIPLLSLIPEPSLPHSLEILMTNQSNQQTGKDSRTCSPDYTPQLW